MDILVVYDEVECGQAKEFITESLKDLHPSFNFSEFTLDKNLNELNLDNISAILFFHIPSDTFFEKVQTVIALGEQKKIKSNSLIYRVFDYSAQIPNINLTKIFSPRFSDFPKYKDNFNTKGLIPLEIILEDRDANPADISKYIGMLSDFIFARNPNLGSDINTKKAKKVKHPILLSVGVLFVLLFVFLIKYFLFNEVSEKSSENKEIKDLGNTEKIDTVNKIIDSTKLGIEKKDTLVLKIEDISDLEKSKLFEKFVKDSILIDSIFYSELFINSEKFLRAKNAKMKFLKGDYFKQLQFLEEYLPKYQDSFFQKIDKPSYKIQILREWFDVLIKVYITEKKRKNRFGEYGLLKIMLKEEENQKLNDSWSIFFNFYSDNWELLESVSIFEVECIAVQIKRLEKSNCTN